MSDKSSSSEKHVRLVVLDWAGTAVDFGCFAPVAPFIEALRSVGIEISHEQARQPMGLHKLDHLRALLKLPEVAEQWRDVHGRDFDEDDVQRIFDEEFIPRQLASAAEHSRLIPGLLEAIATLREQSIKIGTTTGYFAEAAELVYKVAAEQGYVPDANFNASHVPEGRPAPWMIYRNMEATGVYPLASVLKVGDTVPDVQEGLNAGCWAAAVTQTGSEVGLTEEEWNALPTEAQSQRLQQAEQRLRAAGAHFVIRSVAELPRLVEQVNAALAEGRRP